MFYFSLLMVFFLFHGFRTIGLVVTACLPPPPPWTKATTVTAAWESCAEPSPLTSKVPWRDEMLKKPPWFLAWGPNHSAFLYILWNSKRDMARKGWDFRSLEELTALKGPLGSLSRLSSLSAKPSNKALLKKVSHFWRENWNTSTLIH